MNINNKIQIGCKEKTIEEWDLFFGSDEVFETKRNTEEFKQIQAVYESYKAYLTFLNKKNEKLMESFKRREPLKIRKSKNALSNYYKRFNR